MSLPKTTQNATDGQVSEIVLVSHHLCPYVQRAVIALTEKGVAFERRDIDLSRKPNWFTALSPLGKTPGRRGRASAPRLFVWPKGAYAPSIPFRNNFERSAREVSRSEIRGLIDANPDLGDSVDPALDLARLMGIARLSEDARGYLTNCLAAAGIVSLT